MTWQAIALRISTYLTSIFAIPLYALMFAYAGMECAAHKNLRPLGWGLLGAGITFTAAWVVSYFFQGGGGGTLAMRALAWLQVG